MSCGVGRRRGLDPTLLWLWCRLAAVAPIQPLAWEPPYAMCVALKKKIYMCVCVCINIYMLYIYIYKLNHYAVHQKLTQHFIYLFIFCFLGLHPWHMEVPGLGVESELQLPAYTTATAMRSELSLQPPPQLTATPDP